MGKAPAFQFYPGDWFREPGLRASSISAKGAWAQILFSMHDAKERGKLSGDLEYWGRLIGVKPWGEWEQHGSYATTPWTIDSESNKDTALTLLRELVENGVCDIEFDDDISESIFTANGADRNQDVTARNCRVTIINRRMLREFIEAEKNRKKQQRHRDRKNIERLKSDSNHEITQLDNQNVTSHSSSSSSNIINNRKFYYRDNQNNYVCKSCQRIFSLYENFKSHKCGGKDELRQNQDPDLGQQKSGNS